MDLILSKTSMITINSGHLQYHLVVHILRVIRPVFEIKSEKRSLAVHWMDIILLKFLNPNRRPVRFMCSWFILIWLKTLFLEYNFSSGRAVDFLVRPKIELGFQISMRPIADQPTNLLSSSSPHHQHHRFTMFIQLVSTLMMMMTMMMMMRQCVTVPKMLDDTDTDTYFRY